MPVMANTMRYLYILLFGLPGFLMQAQHSTWIALPVTEELVKVHNMHFDNRDYMRANADFTPRILVDSLLISPGKDSVNIYLRYISSVHCLDTADPSNYFYYGRVKDTTSRDWKISKYNLKKISGDSVYAFRYYYAYDIVPLKPFNIIKVTGSLEHYREENTTGIPFYYWDFNNQKQKIKKEKLYSTDTLKKKLSPCGEGMWLTLPLQKNTGLRINNFFIAINRSTIKTVDPKKKIFFDAGHHQYDVASGRWNIEFALSDNSGEPSFGINMRNFGPDTLKIKKCLSSKGFSTVNYSYNYIPPRESLFITFSFNKESLKRGKNWTGYYLFEFESYENLPEIISYNLTITEKK